jgi:hypothetical protein
VPMRIPRSGRLKSQEKNSRQLPQTKNKRDSGQPKLSKKGRRILAIQTALSALLRRAAPRSTARAISWTSVDLAGLWEVCQKHERHISRLLECSYPRDRARIEAIMTEMQVNLLSQATDHLKTLAKTFPRVRQAVYRSSN